MSVQTIIELKSEIEYLQEQLQKETKRPLTQLEMSLDDCVDTLSSYVDRFQKDNSYYRGSEIVNFSKGFVVNGEIFVLSLKYKGEVTKLEEESTTIEFLNLGA